MLLPALVCTATVEPVDMVPAPRLNISPLYEEIPTGDVGPTLILLAVAGATASVTVKLTPSAALPMRYRTSATLPPLNCMLLPVVAVKATVLPFVLIVEVPLLPMLITKSTAVPASANVTALECPDVVLIVAVFRFTVGALILSAALLSIVSMPEIVSVLLAVKLTPFATPVAA